MAYIPTYAATLSRELGAAQTPEIMNRTPPEIEGSIRNRALPVTLGTGAA